MTRKFANSFISKVQPPAGETCSLKWHYTGVMRELVGFLDDMAAKDQTGERFIYTSLTYILEHEKCKRFNGGAYGERALYYAFAELRAQHILTEPVQRERWVPSGKKGHLVLRTLTGGILAPHVCLARLEGDVCHFCGWLTNGIWRAEVPGNSKTIIWAGYHNGVATNKVPISPDAPKSADENAAAVQPECSSQCSPRAGTSAGSSAGTSAVTDSVQDSDSTKVNSKNRDQAFVTVKPDEPVQTGSPVEAEQPSKPAPLAKAASSAGASLASSSSGIGACAPTTGHDITKPGDGWEKMDAMVEKAEAEYQRRKSEITIGLQFAIKDDMLLLSQISDGEFNPYAYKETGDIDTLAKYTRKIIKKVKDHAWDNKRKTCAHIMDATARLINSEGLKYPPGWLKVLRQLREQGSTCNSITEPDVRDNFEEYRATLRRNGKQHINRNQWEMCADKIARRAVDREHFGFTVKAADGIWEKPAP